MVASIVALYFNRDPSLYTVMDWGFMACASVNSSQCGSTLESTTWFHLKADAVPILTQMLDDVIPKKIIESMVGLIDWIIYPLECFLALKVMLH